MKLRRLVASGILMALASALISGPSFSASKITPGSACKVYKSKVIYQGKQFTCIKSGKKLIWSKGVVVKKPTPTPIPKTTSIYPPKTSASAVTHPPSSMQGINDQHFLFSGGMDPEFVTLGPKTGGRPDLGSYSGKTGVNFEIALGKPILAPMDALFIGFNNRNSDLRIAADGTHQVPFDDLQLCFKSIDPDWPGLIYCFYHLRNSPLLLGINKSPTCSNAKEWPGPLRAEGAQFFAENNGVIEASAVSESCMALLGRQVKRGAVVAYSGTVGTHSQAPIMMKVPDASINPTVKSGDAHLHWVQGDVFFYWKCFSDGASFEPGVIAYPWECNGYSVPREEQSVEFKYSR